MSAPQEIHFGVPLYELQALDIIGPIDILSTASYKFMVSFTGEETAKRMKSPNVKFHYISSDLEPVMLTGNVALKPTDTFSDCPKLDYLLLGGPDPDFGLNLPADLKSFIIDRSKEVKAIFTTCTGGLVLAGTGLLAGTHATVNHVILKKAKDMFPNVKWDDSTSWVVDNGADGLKIWTASGAIAGMDMFGQWYLEEFSQEALDWVTSLLEWQPRDVNGKLLQSRNGRFETIQGASKL